MSELYEENVSGQVSSVSSISGEVNDTSPPFKVIFPCTSVADFPTVGKVNALYIDKSATPNIAYRWDSDEAAYIMVSGAGGEGGVTDYNQLSNQPSINGVTLTGNLTSDDLNIESGDASVVIDTETEITEETLLVIDPEATADKIPQWYNGTLVAAAGETDVDGSAAGDYYINTDTFDVYHATAANTWELVGNIKGNSGSTGIFFGAYDGSDGEPPEDAVLWIDPNEAADTDFLTTDTLVLALSSISNDISIEANEFSGFTMRCGKILIQTGDATITPSASNTNTSLSVAFPVEFATAPFVIGAPKTGVPASVYVSTYAATTTGFTIVLNRSGTTLTGIKWIAVGMGA